jgi:hypothetical protein
MKRDIKVREGEIKILNVEKHEIINLAGAVSKAVF